MVLASVSSSVKNWDDHILLPTLKSLGSYSEIVTGKALVDTQDVGAFLLGNTCIGLRGWVGFTVHIIQIATIMCILTLEPGKVGDLHEHVHEHFKLSTKDRHGSAKAQILMATSIPTLSPSGTHAWDSLLLGCTTDLTQYPWFAYDKKTICFHNPTLSRLRCIFLSWKWPVQMHHFLTTHSLTQQIGTII